MSIDFTASDSILCEENNGPIDFTSLIEGFGTVTAYNWTFQGGNPASSTDENPTGIIFNGPGVYEVQLEVMTTYCQETLVKTDYITIHPQPQANFDLTTDRGCSPLRVDFTDLSTIGSGQIVDWQWDFGNGQTANTPNPSHVFETGNYVVSLRTTSDNGCVDTHVQSIIVDASPRVVAEGGKYICINDFAQLNAILLEGENVSYSWTPSIGLSCSDCPAPLASPDTTTIYELLVTNGNGCTASDTTRVEVGPHALPIIQLTADTVICTGESVALLASGGVLPSDYTWDDSRPGLSCYESCVSPVASPTETTTYIVQVEGEGGCIAYDSVTVSILDQNQDLLGADRIICDGEEVQLEVALGNDPQWSPSAGLSCDDCPNPNASPTENTTYQVQITTDQGCVLLDSIRIDVLYPESVFAGLDTSICENSEITLAAEYSGTAVWTANGVNVAGDTPNPVLYPNGDTEYVLAVTNDLCTIYDTIAVSVIGQATLSATDYHLCQGDSIWLEVTGDANTFRWFPSDGLSQTDMSFVLASPEESTSYQVLGSIDGCEADTVDIFVEVIQAPNVELEGRSRFKLG
ncbi:MAG: PKD domain-containing protein, partial [Bacteroidota bacterium]